MGIIRVTRNEKIPRHTEIIVQTEHLRTINQGLSCFNILCPPNNLIRISTKTYIVLDAKCPDKILLEIQVFNKNATVSYYYEQFVGETRCQMVSKYLMSISEDSKNALNEICGDENP